MNNHIMKILTYQANKNHDGHFSIMKFTTNWRVGFGTPDSRESINETLFGGDTFEDAALRAIEHDLSKQEI